MGSTEQAEPLTAIGRGQRFGALQRIVIMKPLNLIFPAPRCAAHDARALKARGSDIIDRLSCHAPRSLRASLLPWRRLTPALAAGALCSHVWAQAVPARPSAAPSADEVPSLQEVTVSAGGLDRSSADMAAPVSVLEGDELMLRRGATLGETLEGEPGIRASHFGAGASRPVVRGMDGPRVQVLSDGAEVQDASSVSPDHAVTAEPMLARQIEVLRGPSALIHGGNGVGGVINVLDHKVPTAVPVNGVEGSAEVRAQSVSRGQAGAAQVTFGRGPLVLHVEGAARDDGAYRVGRGWSDGGRVPGSFNRTKTGGLGLSWVDTQGYLGLAYTRQEARYGLPGHAHGGEDCHPHGDHLHCGGHGDHDHDGHDHDDHAAAGVPVVDLRSNRWDLRGEWREPVAGVTAVRLRGGLTDYEHDEREDGAVATTFRNRAYDLRLEVQHRPVMGWQGVVGLSTSQRKFSALGEEAYVQPSVTRRHSVFWLETLAWRDWRFEAALRHERQTTRLQDAGDGRTHHGTSGSLGVIWRFHPGYQAWASATTAQRMPTAEELYARGPHMATRTFERGNPALGGERARNLDIGVRKNTGATTFSVSAFHNRVAGYIYGRTVDAQEGVQLLDHTQAGARFTGIEAQVRQRIDRNLGVTAFGDMVRARLADGSRLPRVAPGRYGLRLDAHWQGWEGMVEWVQTRGVRRVTEHESPTGGYGMLNLGLTYTRPLADGRRWQVYVRGSNLTNRLAFSHLSYIKDAAPLAGRNIAVGARYVF